MPFELIKQKKNYFTGDVMKPKPVQNLAAWESVSDGVTLSWSSYDCEALSNPFEHYEVFVGSRLQGEFTSLEMTSLVIKGLEPLTLYSTTVLVKSSGPSWAATGATIDVCTGQYSRN